MAVIRCGLKNFCTESKSNVLKLYNEHKQTVGSGRKCLNLISSSCTVSKNDKRSLLCSSKDAHTSIYGCRQKDSAKQLYTRNKKELFQCKHCDVNDRQVMNQIAKKNDPGLLKLATNSKSDSLLVFWNNYQTKAAFVKLLTTLSETNTAKYKSKKIYNRHGKKCKNGITRPSLKCIMFKHKCRLMRERNQIQLIKKRFSLKTNKSNKIMGAMKQIISCAIDMWTKVTVKNSFFKSVCKHHLLAQQRNFKYNNSSLKRLKSLQNLISQSSFKEPCNKMECNANKPVKCKFYSNINNNNLKQNLSTLDSNNCKKLYYKKERSSPLLNTSRQIIKTLADSVFCSHNDKKKSSELASEQPASTETRDRVSNTDVVNPGYFYRCGLTPSQSTEHASKQPGSRKTRDSATSIKNVCKSKHCSSSQTNDCEQPLKKQQLKLFAIPRSIMVKCICIKPQNIFKTDGLNDIRGMLPKIDFRRDNIKNVAQSIEYKCRCIMKPSFYSFKNDTRRYFHFTAHNRNEKLPKCLVKNDTSKSRCVENHSKESIDQLDSGIMKDSIQQLNDCINAMKKSLSRKKIFYLNDLRRCKNTTDIVEILLDELPCNKGKAAENNEKVNRTKKNESSKYDTFKHVETFSSGYKGLNNKTNLPFKKVEKVEEADVTTEIDNKVDQNKVNLPHKLGFSFERRQISSPATNNHVLNCCFVKSMSNENCERNTISSNIKTIFKRFYRNNRLVKGDNDSTNKEADLLISKITNSLLYKNTDSKNADSHDYTNELDNTYEKQFPEDEEYSSKNYSNQNSDENDYKENEREETKEDEDNNSSPNIVVTQCSVSNRKKKHQPDPTEFVNFSSECETPNTAKLLTINANNSPKDEVNKTKQSGGSMINYVKDVTAKNNTFFNLDSEMKEDDISVNNINRTIYKTSKWDDRNVDNQSENLETVNSTVMEKDKQTSKNEIDFSNMCRLKSLMLLKKLEEHINIPKSFLLAKSLTDVNNSRSKNGNSAKNVYIGDTENNETYDKYHYINPYSTINIDQVILHKIANKISPGNLNKMKKSTEYINKLETSERKHLDKSSNDLSESSMPAVKGMNLLTIMNDSKFLLSRNKCKSFLQKENASKNAPQLENKLDDSTNSEKVDTSNSFPSFNLLTNIRNQMNFNQHRELSDNNIEFKFYGVKYPTKSQSFSKSRSGYLKENKDETDYKYMAPVRSILMNDAKIKSKYVDDADNPSEIKKYCFQMHKYKYKHPKTDLQDTCTITRPVHRSVSNFYKSGNKVYKSRQNMTYFFSINNENQSKNNFSGNSKRNKSSNSRNTTFRPNTRHNRFNLAPSSWKNKTVLGKKNATLSLKKDYKKNVRLTMTRNLRTPDEWLIAQGNKIKKSTLKTLPSLNVSRTSSKEKIIRYIKKKLSPIETVPRIFSNVKIMLNDKPFKFNNTSRSISMKSNDLEKKIKSYQKTGTNYFTNFSNKYNSSQRKTKTFEPFISKVNTKGNTKKYIKRKLGEV